MDANGRPLEIEDDVADPGILKTLRVRTALHSRLQQFFQKKAISSTIYNVHDNIMSTRTSGDSMLIFERITAYLSDDASPTIDKELSIEEYAIQQLCIRLFSELLNMQNWVRLVIQKHDDMSVQTSTEEKVLDKMREWKHFLLKKMCFDFDVGEIVINHVSLARSPDVLSWYRTTDVVKQAIKLGFRLFNHHKENQSHVRAIMEEGQELGEQSQYFLIGVVSLLEHIAWHFQSLSSIRSDKMKEDLDFACTVLQFIAVLVNGQNEETQIFLTKQPQRFRRRCDVVEKIVEFLQVFYESVLCRFYLSEAMYNKVDDCFQRDYKRQQTSWSAARRMICWQAFDLATLQSHQQDFRVCMQIFDTLTSFFEGPNRELQAKMCSETGKYLVICEIASVLLEYCASRKFYSNALDQLSSARCNGWRTKNGRGHIFSCNPLTYAVWILTFVKQNEQIARRYLTIFPRQAYDNVLHNMSFCELKILQFVLRNLEGGQSVQLLRYLKQSFGEQLLLLLLDAHCYYKITISYRDERGVSGVLESVTVDSTKKTPNIGAKWVHENTFLDHARDEPLAFSDSTALPSVILLYYTFLEHLNVEFKDVEVRLAAWEQLTVPYPKQPAANKTKTQQDVLRELGSVEVTRKLHHNLRV
eukprot:SAG31_NODE_494_length_14867_cov_2.833762_4_plen_642_part_00